MKTLIGKVISTRMAKTIIVEIVRQQVHPLYKKIMRRSKKYKVHNEDVAIKVGDVVKIAPVKPLSKDKHYKVVIKL